MELSKASPFPSATDVPLHGNPPLAPSQELAYRNKCIQLKRRLNEIETNNDSTRKRISVEKERIQKMRLMRAILMNTLKEVMETPGRKLTTEQLKSLGIPVIGDADDGDMTQMGTSIKTRPEGEAMLDDSSDDSDEDIPEPSDRPTRTRRQNNSYRETIMNTSATPSNPNNTSSSIYPQAGLPAIAPASSAFSPTASRDPAILTSSMQTPLAIGSPTYGIQQSSFVSDSRYPQHSSPIQSSQPTSLYRNASRSTSVAHAQQSSIGSDLNGLSRTPHLIPQPIRPKPPFEQFCDHMRPQLEADHYPPDQIQPRIDREWAELSSENRRLWDERYQDQMMEYEQAMDQYKRAQRRGEAAAPGVIGPSSVLAPFSSINRA